MSSQGKIWSKYNDDLEMSFSEKYSELLKSHLWTTDIDYNKLSENLPYTRKSTTTTAIKNLSEAYNKGNLSLIVGAGISMKFGIPSWDELLQRLLLKTIEQEPETATILSKIYTKIFNPSPLIAARFLQAEIDPKSIHAFEDAVRNALYETFDTNAESKTMEEIVQLCIAPGTTPNLDSIISYNYDNIIEEKIIAKGLGLRFQSIFGQGVDPDYKSLLIYHVHGFLPREGKISEKNTITLGESVYHEQYNAIYSWNNIVQINKFRDKTCLFIGTSLSDPNIRRLLDIANSQKVNKKKFHYIIKRKQKAEEVKSTLEKVFIDNPKIFDEKVKEKIKIDETVKLLIDMQNRFEEIDSESLGVKTVWIDDYDTDIANILKKIGEDNAA